MAWLRIQGLGFKMSETRSEFVLVTLGSAQPLGDAGFRAEPG